MGFLIVKYLVTATIIVAVSEVAKRSDKLGALIISLPIMTIITLFWLNFENQPDQKISNHAYYTFWYVVPTLPMFLAFPLLMKAFWLWLLYADFINRDFCAIGNYRVYSGQI
jgi:hypothetical protein